MRVPGSGGRRVHLDQGLYGRTEGGGRRAAPGEVEAGSHGGGE